MTRTMLLTMALLAFLTPYAQTANRYDIVITEIMADPSPVVGLPNAEFIEIKNISTTPYNLTGWRIGDATGTATISVSFVLQPDSVVILCGNSNVSAFSAFGKTIGVTSFPGLDNAGDVLTLRSPQNNIIHSVAYASDWYGNEVKEDGGWTLEMIDPKSPCVGKPNWKASTSNLGGTPGKTNSVNAVYTDDTPPQLKRAYAADSVTIILVFDEMVDSLQAGVVANYTLPGITISTATTIAPSYFSVQLNLSAPLLPGTVYNISVSKVTDCKGNTIGAYNKAKLGLPQDAAPTDVVINEILFNPQPGGSDYVEFYNRSNKVIDASGLYIANRNSSGTPASLKKLSDAPFYLFPGDYLVVTEDAAILEKAYLVKNRDAVLPLSSPPSFPDDKGTVLLLDVHGNIIDELTYEDDWHFGLVDNDDGVALERIDPDAPTQNKSAWHSAAATAGYGTPTYLNSQFRKTDDIKATLSVLPKIFSPDNDGRDDIATIYYQLEERGYVANVVIFDANGRIVRHLVRNDLLQLKGTWVWDGLGENHTKLPIGNYIILTEVFNLQGKKKAFKNTVVLARSFN